MRLAAGDKLGPYEILACIGIGGMGEVYRARDSRLSRDVAIKVSQERFSDRFEREARAVAALNHPNVCTVHDVGPNYLVMELIEGESPKGPLPLEEALRIARQIIDALEAAHEKGIVHRDLKPANIKVKPDGTVKVLDFGLVKMSDITTGSPDSTITMAMSPTHVGAVMGTFGYMSPEQERGKPVDKRADIWAFGVVLYELLMGRRPFHGDDVSEKPWFEGVPPQVRRLLHSCLEKDPKNRLRDIGDAWRLLEESPVSPETEGVVRRPLWFAVGATVLLAGLAAWGWLRMPQPPAPRPVTRWTMAFPARATYFSLSRDGTRLVYWYGEGNYIWLRMMDQLDAKPIPGAQGGYPFFSPDGKWVVYTAADDQTRVKKIPVAGGTPITLCQDSTGGGASWGDDDTILLGGTYTGQGLRRLPAAGGDTRVLTRPDTKAGERRHVHPQWLPGGQAALFTIIKGAADDSTHIALLELKTGHYSVVVQGGADARYVPTGHLVYLRGGTLYAVTFDLKRMAVTGTETRIVERVTSWIGSSRADYSVSDSGLLVFRPGGFRDARLRRLVWADRNGNRHEPVNVPPKIYYIASISPDGKRAAVEVVERKYLARSDIWVIDLARDTSLRLTSEGSNSRPIWTPDGRRLTFVSRRDGKTRMYWTLADGSGEPELLLSEGDPVPTAWSPDGKTLLYYQLDQDRNYHIWMLSKPGSGGESKPRRFLETSFDQTGAVFSPDGHWLAYTTNQTGRYEIYARPFPGPGEQLLISSQGGNAPRWYGHEIFFAGVNGALTKVDVQTSPRLYAGPPQVLFKPVPPSSFEVSPDGKRVLLLEYPDQPGENEALEAVVNWFEELRLRVPTR
jgi:serine/threonine-protein kinase